MADRVSDNLAMLTRVVNRLGPLRERLVFLGGAVAELFITQPGGPGPRQTKDVDVIIDVVNLGEYSETLREQLVAVIAAQLLPDAKSQDRLPFVLDRIRGLIAAAT